MVIGTIAAAVAGAALPVMIIIFGDMIDTFVDTENIELLVKKLSEYITYKGLNVSQVIKDKSLLL